MRGSKNKHGKPVSQFLATAASVGIFVYFFYHLMHGDRGYFALKGVEDKLETAQTQYEELVEKRMALENRVKMLRPDSIDLDLLDERVRAVLGYVRPQEKIILTH